MKLNMTSEEYKKILREVQNSFKSNLRNNMSKEEFLSDFFNEFRYYHSEEYKKNGKNMLDLALTINVVIIIATICDDNTYIYYISFLILIICKYRINKCFKEISKSSEILEMALSKYNNLSKNIENEIIKIETAIEFLNGLTKEEEEKYLKFKM